MILHITGLALCTAGAFLIYRPTRSGSKQGALLLFIGFVLQLVTALSIYM